MGYYNTLNKMAQKKRPDYQVERHHVENQHCYALLIISGFNQFGKLVGRICKANHVREMSAYAHQKICTRMFITALFLMSKM